MSMAATSSSAMSTLTPGDIGRRGAACLGAASPRCRATSSLDLHKRAQRASHWWQLLYLRPLCPKHLGECLEWQGRKGQNNP